MSNPISTPNSNPEAPEPKTLAWQWIATAVVVCGVAFIAGGTFVRFSEAARVSQPAAR